MTAPTRPALAPLLGYAPPSGWWGDDRAGGILDLGRFEIHLCRQAGGELRAWWSAEDSSFGMLLVGLA